jgi:hypothetical protein
LHGWFPEILKCKGVSALGEGLAMRDYRDDLSSHRWVALATMSVTESDGMRPISILILAANSQSLKTGSDSGHYRQEMQHQLPI